MQLLKKYFKSEPYKPILARNLCTQKKSREENEFFSKYKDTYQSGMFLNGASSLSTVFFCMI